jgi:patatin-like phospholipase/acyl hydrolase
MKMADSEKAKKLLALDGGGIRGALSIEILAEIERLLRARSGKADLVLADYFDYVAGTSTGAIIAACISIGMPVEKIREFYEKSGPQMFDPASLLKRLKYKFESEPLAQMLQQVFGADTQFGSDKLRTLLLIIMRNATTDSPWPMSNNPDAKYSDRTRPDSNLKFPLWQLVRASTAAPTYFPPEVIEVGEKQFIFVDGGVTMYNNPAFQLFVMATAEPYKLQWQPGEKQMLLVSIGTGTAPNAKNGLRPEEMHLLYNASSIPSALMFAAMNEQDLLCRVFGNCLAGDPIDREVCDLIGKRGPVEPKLFTYVRYNAELTKEGLAALGIDDVDPRHVQQLDSVQHIDKLQRVGRAVAKTKVRAEHFAGFA